MKTKELISEQEKLQEQAQPNREQEFEPTYEQPMMKKALDTKNEQSVITKESDAKNEQSMIAKESEAKNEQPMMVKKPESNYVQQHLANERTFLAWIRTTMSIMGVGLVTTSLHFELSTNFNMQADKIIKVVGYSTLLLGVLMLAFSVISYLKKRKGINDGTFHSTSTFIVFMSAFMALIGFLFGMYLFKSY